MAKAVFLDKDGTLVENVPYNVDPDQVRLMAGAIDALRLLSRAGFRLIVVSNQSGVARGYFEESAIQGVRRRLEELLGEGGVLLDGFYYCPHLPAGVVPRYAVECDCRKPRTGMFQRAAAELGIDLQASWMIGDILDDVEAAHAAGSRAVLLDNGNETEWKVCPNRWPEYVASTLASAANHILSLTEAL